VSPLNQYIYIYFKVAKHLGINYSTAKAIAKENRYLFKERQTDHSEYE
jgi:hypothetical protein